MQQGARETHLVAGLPATVPFVGPEAIERQTGRRIRLRLGANESSFGPSPLAIEAMTSAVHQIAHYGDPENFELRAALARQHGVSMEHVAIASGIDDLLGLVVRGFLEAGQTAVTSLGAYPTFNYHVAGFGGLLERVPYRDDRNDLEALALAAHRTGAPLVYLSNPDNPSGSYHSAAAIASFLDILPSRCLLLLDEAYVDFAPADAIPAIDVDETRVLRVRTFSKAHGMAGARIGYALGTVENIRVFTKIGLHFGVNLPAQMGALASLTDADHLRTVVAEVARGREEYYQLAAKLRLPAVRSTTNFVSIDTGDSAHARALVAALAARDVFIRMPGAPPLDRLVRVTVGTPAERAAFAEILQEVWPAVSATGPA